MNDTNNQNPAQKNTDDDSMNGSEQRPSGDTDNVAMIDVDDLKAQLLKATNDYLYLRAEFDNFRKQSIKERSELLRYGGERLAKDLLDSLDIFETALSAEVTPENFKSFVDGIKLTSQQLTSCLQKHGITNIDCLGQPFDPSTSEALSSEPTDSMPEGHVTKVFKKPYKYHDKVLRIGQVIVARAKES